MNLSCGKLIVSALILLGFALAQTPDCISVEAQGIEKNKEQTFLANKIMLLCELKLDGNPLSDDVLTYMSLREGHVEMFLPLGECSRQLELGITVDPANGRAAGHIATTSVSFMLDMKSSSIMVSGKAYRYDPALVIALSDDIYVESGLLAEWLAMHIDANRASANVNIRPFEPLPLQHRMARELRGSNKWGYGSNMDSGYPLIPTPFQALDVPSVDLTLSPSITNNPQQKGLLGQAPFYARIAGDVLWMNGQMEFSGQPFASVDHGRLFLERIIPSCNLLGPLGARKLAFGDIQPDPLPIIGGSNGPGFMISSYSSSQTSFFDTVSLSGFLGNGWDVELFCNNSVLDYRPSNPQQNYSFVNIPLNYGMNELKLIFHGPQGEERIETHFYNIGQNMIEPGSFRYQVTGTDVSRSSILASSSEQVTPLMTWKSTVGLNKWLTTSNYLASIVNNNERQTIAGGGFSGYLKMMQVDLQMAKNLATGQLARQMGFQTKLYPVALSFLSKEYDQGWRTTTGAASYLNQREARISGIPLIPFSRTSKLSMAFTQTEYDKHRSGKSAILTNNSRIWGIDHAHSFTFERIHNENTFNDILSGNSYASLMRQNFSFRAQLDYHFFPESGINTISTTYQRPIKNEWLFTNGMAFSPQSKVYAISLGLSRTTNVGAIAPGFTANYTIGGTWGIGLMLSTNISHEPRTGSWKANGSLNSQQGGVSALVFLDENRNRVFDEGEKKLNDAGFFVNKQSHKTATNSTGIASLQGLSSGMPIDISVSPATLEELVWVPADKGIQVVPRPGYVAKVDFPVWVTGEISGTVYRRKLGMKSSAAGILVEAVDKAGNVTAKNLSGYDGFYTLKALPTGLFTVRVSPEQAVKLQTNAPFSQVSIPSKGDYIDNINLVLDELASDAASLPATTPAATGPTETTPQASASPANTPMVDAPATAKPTTNEQRDTTLPAADQ